LVLTDARAALQKLRDVRAHPRSDRGGPARPFAICEVFTDLEAAHDPWVELEALGGGTPYQNRQFLGAWLRTIGRRKGVSPFIIVARDEKGKATALLPFGAMRWGPVRVAMFLGGKDSNFNLCLFRPGLDVGRDALIELLNRAAALAEPGIAGYLCLNQPREWRGVENPFILLGGQPSPSFGHKTSLGGDFSNWLNAHYSRSSHKKLRRKCHHLNAVGPVRHAIARDTASAKAIVEAYCAQKDVRMRTLGLSRLWDRASALQFLTQLSPACPDGRTLELHALHCGDRLAAVFGGLAAADRFCGAFISYDSDPRIARCSPGELLLNDIVRDLIERGFATFDLGVGEARYKSHCCEIEEPLFDSFVPTSFVGRSLGAWLLGRLRVKRLLKQTPPIWTLLKTLRRKLG
jgi:CelD/BcsL family acetyltransferase involved in cellulose biosynthesis